MLPLLHEPFGGFDAGAGDPGSLDQRHTFTDVQSSSARTQLIRHRPVRPHRPVQPPPEARTRPLPKPAVRGPERHPKRRRQIPAPHTKISQSPREAHSK